MEKKNFSIKRISADQAGVILIITLIIMAILLSTAIGFGAFIISDLRQAGAIDDSLAAYHAAEAGLERQLFYLRHFENIKTAADLKTIILNGGESPVSLGAAGASWQIAESQDYEPVFYRQRLKNGENAKFYILGRAGETPTNATKAVKIDWQKGEGVIDVKIQVNFTQLEPQTYNEGTDPIVVFYTDNSVLIPNREDPKNCIPLRTGNERNVDPSCASGVGNCNIDHDYVVEIKALGSGADYLERMEVRTYSDESCEAGNEVKEGISNITLKATGFYNKSRQQIVAQIPPKDAASGLLGFVLFSEEDITKGY